MGPWTGVWKRGKARRLSVYAIPLPSCSKVKGLSSESNRVQWLTLLGALILPLPRPAPIILYDGAGAHDAQDTAHGFVSKFL